MQGGGGAVEADIGDELAGQRLPVQRFHVGALMDETPCGKRAQEIGFRLEIGHEALGFREV